VKSLFFALTLALAGVGSAHADLASSTPVAGAVLERAPDEVTLTFTEAVEVRFSTLKVYALEADVDPDDPDAEARLNGLAGQLVTEVLSASDDTDARVDLGVSDAARTADTVTLTLEPELGAGVYVVMWRVLAVDTHTTQGFFTFRVEP
jgi:copper resistance protein C